MNGFVTPVGIAATVATTLMVGAMLYLVWSAMGSDVHSPTPADGAAAPDVADDEGADAPDVEGDAEAA